MLLEASSSCDRRGILLVRRRFLQVQTHARKEALDSYEALFPGFLIPRVHGLQRTEIEATEIEAGEWASKPNFFNSPWPGNRRLVESTTNKKQKSHPCFPGLGSRCFLRYGPKGISLLGRVFLLGVRVPPKFRLPDLIQASFSGPLDRDGCSLCEDWSKVLRSDRRCVEPCKASPEEF